MTLAERKIGRRDRRAVIEAAWRLSADTYVIHRLVDEMKVPVRCPECRGMGHTLRPAYPRVFCELCAGYGMLRPHFPNARKCTCQTCKMGIPITPNGGDISVTWDSSANKIFKL